jgi:SAM-dependent methyltransferase
VDPVDAPFYRRNLAVVHHEGFGSHADACAPGILRLLEPARHHRGLVLELGCGGGRLTRHLVDAGHRVIATDASPAMLELAGTHVPDAEDVRRLALPDDPIPEVDAIVSVGHVLGYLPDQAAVERALVRIADALRPGGALAIDMCDLRYGAARAGTPPFARVEDGWAVFTETEQPAPHMLARRITTFVRHDDQAWQRDDEQHTNVLLDTAAVPDLLATHGVTATVQASFGDETLPEGQVAVIGHRAQAAPQPGSRR